MGLCGYVWAKILTLSPLRVIEGKRSNYSESSLPINGDSFMHLLWYGSESIKPTKNVIEATARDGEMSMCLITPKAISVSERRQCFERLLWLPAWWMEPRKTLTATWLNGKYGGFPPELGISSLRYVGIRNEWQQNWIVGICELGTALSRRSRTCHVLYGLTGIEQTSCI